MAIFDLLQMSGNNLLRRKVRTLLTILGVVIGTASIVVMLSLGLGLKRTSMKQIEQSGGLTTIQVYPNEGMSDIAGNGDKKNRKLITRSKILLFLLAKEKVLPRPTRLKNIFSRYAACWLVAQKNIPITVI